MITGLVGPRICSRFQFFCLRDLGFLCPNWLRHKVSAYNAGDLGSIPGLGRSPGEGHGNPLQYSYLENPMDGGTWSGYSSWGRKELDTTERLHSLTHSKVVYSNLIRGFPSSLL